MGSNRSARLVVAVTLLVALMAGCGGGGGGGSGTPPPLPPAPTPPTGVTATTGNAQAALSWTAVSGATSYNVYTTSTSPATTASTRTTVSGTSTTLSLTNGTPVFAAVSAVNAGGESALSSEVCAVPTPASQAGLTMYDPLCSSTLDGSKWRDGLFTRGVSNGAMLLSAQASNMESVSSRGLVYVTSAAVAAGSQRVTTLQANISVPAATASRSGGAEIRAALLVSYQPPANRLDFPAALLNRLSITVGLEDVGNGLVAFRRVAHCDNASCTSETSTGITFAAEPAGFTGSAPASYDTTYTVRASLNEATGVLSWSISGGALGTLSGTADPSAYLAGNATWAALGANPLAGAAFFGGELRARVLDRTAGSAGNISARFDDVLVGLDNAAATLWDNFNGPSSVADPSNSGPVELIETRWTPGEHSRALTGGSLVERIRLSKVPTDSTSPVSYSQALIFSDTSARNTIQADVTVNACTESSSTTSFVELVSTLYNDGTPGTTSPNINQANSSVGDVQAHLRLSCSGGAGGVRIIRWNSQSPRQSTTLSSSTNNFVPMGSVSLRGNMHTLRISWDPATRRVTFQVDDATPLVVDPTTPNTHMTTGAPFVRAANSPFQAIGAFLLIIQGVGSSNASMDYKVNNVFTAP